MGRLTLKDRGVFHLLTATMRGHRPPGESLTEATCLIHTPRCIYALDEDGICTEVVPTTPGPVRDAQRCRGAQYVACLDMRTEEGLIAEPRVGARALFVGRGTGLRMALIKTATITRVERPEPEPFTRRNLCSPGKDAPPRPPKARARIPSVPVPAGLLELLRSERN